MAMAQSCPGQAATDASIADGAAEARRTALDERIGFALQRAQRLFEQSAQFDDARQIFVGAGLAFDASAREHLDILGQRAQFLAAELARSEEHTSELQSLMRISYAVFCLKKKNTQSTQTVITITQQQT